MRAEVSQRTTVRLSAITVDDQPWAPEPHTFRGLRHAQESTRMSVTTGMLGAPVVVDIAW